MNTGPTNRKPACMNMRARMPSRPNRTARCPNMRTSRSASLPALSMCRSQSPKATSNSAPTTTNGITGETPPWAMSACLKATTGTRAATQPYLLACSTPSTMIARPSAWSTAPTPSSLTLARVLRGTLMRCARSRVTMTTQTSMANE